MYQFYGEYTVITVNDWRAAGLSQNVFEHDSKRGDLTIVKRGIHGNTLIDVNSIRRRDRLSKIEAVYGKINNNKLIYNIEPDQKAKVFFDAYRYGENSDKVLPEFTKSMYCNSASILNSLISVLHTCRAARATNNKTVKMKDFYSVGSTFAKDSNDNYPNVLPYSSRAFERKFKEYLTNGYESLISGKFGNTNTVKLTKEAQEWVLARWASPIDKLCLVQLFNEYNNISEEHGWEKLKSKNTLYLFLNRKDIKSVWYGMRYGELKYKNIYVPQHRTILPTKRDGLWVWRRHQA